MNKLLKRISLVGLLFSTSCGYSNQDSGLELEACINVENGNTLCKLESDYELSCDATVGVLPNGYMLNKDKNTIHTVFARCNKTKNAWSTDGKNFNIIAVDGNLYKFNDNKTKIFASNIDSVVLYEQDSKTSIWYETDTPTGNEIIVMDLTGDNSDYIMIGDTICKKEVLFIRNNSNYSWIDANIYNNGSNNANNIINGVIVNVDMYVPKQMTSAQFDFNAKNLTLNCTTKTEGQSTTYLPSTFRVTQFGKVNCPSGSTLTLSPTDDVENVLLLEPGSKVGSSTENNNLLVDNGIIDLSKYFKDENSLKQGENIYLSLKQEQVSFMTDELLNTTSKIKLFNTEEELINLKNTMKNYNSSEPVFKNISLNNSNLLLTKTSIDGTILSNSIIMKLFDYGDNSSQIVQKLQEEAIEEIFNNVEVPTTIDVSELIGASEESVTIQPSILQKILENENLTLSGNGDINIDFTGISESENNINNIELSQIVSNNFTGNIILQNLPDNVEKISVDKLENVNLELKDNVEIKEIELKQSNTTVSLSGSGTIGELSVPSSSCIRFTQGSNIKLGVS